MNYSPKKIFKKIYNNKKIKDEKIYIENILKIANFDIIHNTIPKKIKSINFVIPGMGAYSGGHTSILRLGTELSEIGYRVFYTSYIKQDKNEMELNAKINLSNYKGEIIPFEEMGEEEYDIVIATSWQSAYYVKNMPGYKMYFIQDYEPYFYDYGELFLLSQKTYELGLDMVSLGEWNKAMINKNCKNINTIKYIEFPYEESEYTYKCRNYENYSKKDKIIIAVYVKNTGKRLPYIIQNMLCNIKNKFKLENKEVVLKYYGETKDFICDGGENLGKLSKKQLVDLYHEADFGMVASFTNISLVPYEMLSSGLPIIEFKEGTFEFFFPEDTAIITSIDSDELYLKLRDAINNPKLIEDKMNNAREYMKTLSWKKSAEQFDKILREILEEGDC